MEYMGDVNVRDMGDREEGPFAFPVEIPAWNILSSKELVALLKMLLGIPRPGYYHPCHAGYGIIMVVFSVG